MKRPLFSLHRLLTASLLLLCTGMVFAKQAAPATPSPQVQWITYYYKNPQPERFAEEVRKMSQAGMMQNKDAQPACAAFFSQIMAQNPKKIAEWMAALDDLPEADKKQVLYPAVAFSHTAEGSAFLEGKGLKYKLPEILDLEVNNSAVNDMLWGYFMASGKEEPIRRIVSAFNLAPYAGAVEKYKTSKQTDEDKKAVEYDLTFKSACWSLQSNCKQHLRVREICETLLSGNRLNPVERRWLNTILQQQDATAQKGAKRFADMPTWKSKDGFGAMLNLTEDGQYFEDWAKPETPRLTTTNKARRNIPLYTVVQFNNPGLKPDGTADITADTKTLKPDGSVYGESKNIVCWKGKYDAPAQNLQLAQTHMALRIEPQDPEGVYTVEVVVRDNVKKVELPLKTTFEVSK